MLRSVSVVGTYVARSVLGIRKFIHSFLMLLLRDCANCSRPKLHKYPDGYPGDAEPPIEMPQRQWRKPRQRVRYTCHICSIMYRAGERSCSGCGQERGPQTLRDPYVYHYNHHDQSKPDYWLLNRPKKIKPDADPEIVRRVQERLAELDIIA